MFGGRSSLIMKVKCFQEQTSVAIAGGCKDNLERFTSWRSAHAGWSGEADCREKEK